jgi:acetoin utilization deacetylase AcuC-like enzyme
MEQAMPESSNAQFVYTIVPSPDHDLASHPENAGRFNRFDLLRELAEKEGFLEVESSLAPMDTVTAVHPPSYLDALREAVEEGPAYIDYAPTYVTPASFDAALHAAGGTLNVLESVLNGQKQGGFALVRPPGHHATATRAMGFCLFNNVAIAARHCQKLGFQRVMIVDIDVHHGNGTQDIFENDPNVLYVSTHQSGIYPGTGQLDETGIYDGKGSVVNIPLPARAGDAAFENVADRILAPLAKRFTPSALLVSVGFDAHWNDPLASLQLSCSGYHMLASKLAKIASEHCAGNILAVLEGGYDPEALVHSVIAVIQGMRGAQVPDDPLGASPLTETDVSPLIDAVAALHNLA